VALTSSPRAPVGTAGSTLGVPSIVASSADHAVGGEGVGTSRASLSSSTTWTSGSDGAVTGPPGSGHTTLTTGRHTATVASGNSDTGVLHNPTSDPQRATASRTGSESREPSTERGCNKATTPPASTDSIAASRCRPAASV
jgi:hypothetical protein